MLKKEELKLKAASMALELIEPGMVVGLGSGSTATLFIKLLGKKVQEGLRIRAIASSEDSAKLGEELGIPMIDFRQVTALDIAVDGADEVAPGLALIKGGGGKLLHEKIVASAANMFVVVVDSSKLVRKLGQFPLPIEVIPMAQPLISAKLERLGHFTQIRQSADKRSDYITEEGNLILDCAPQIIEDPGSLGALISEMPGVVEHGLFVGLANLALIAFEDGVKRYTTESTLE